MSRSPTPGRTSISVRTAAWSRSSDPSGPGRLGVETDVLGLEREHVPSHLLLGAHAAQAAMACSKRQIEEAGAWQQVSASADFSRP